jgi:hypothetical protein
MEKYLSIPVTSKGNQLISCNGILSVYSATATGADVVITYKSGTTATITSANQVNFDMRNQIQDEIALALATGWTNVSREVSPVKTVSGIVVA